MNDFTTDQHDSNRFKVMWYLKRREFKYELTFSGSICHFVNHIFKTEFVLFDIRFNARYRYTSDYSYLKISEKFSFSVFLVSTLKSAGKF